MSCCQVDNRDRVSSQARFHAETVSPRITVDDTLKQTMIVEIVKNLVHPFATIVLPDASRLFKLSCTLVHYTNIQHWFAKQDEGAGLATIFPRSHQINNLRNVLQKQAQYMEAQFLSLRDSKDLLIRPTPCKANGLNSVADRCVFYSSHYSNV